MFKNWFSWWQRKKQMPVIQIGVGGYASSGKTMLIDAMFALFANVHRPYYMRDRHPKEGIFTDEKFRKSYRSYAELRAHVNKYLTGKQTVDNGVWNENTHFGRLRFCGKETIILIRNIPGELFSNFYNTNPALNNQSIHELFTVFADGEGKAWRTWFKEQKGEELKKMRDDFFDVYLTKAIPGHDAETGVHKKNFFAYLFYASSDFNIYCIKSDVEFKTETTNEFADNTTNLQILADRDVKNDSPLYICFTQMDKSLNTNTVPTFATTKAADIIPKERPIKDKPGFFQGIKRTLLGQEPGKQHRQEVPTELMQYWQTMELLHRDFRTGRRNGHWDYFNQEQMLTLKNLVDDNHRFPIFISSVAYNSQDHRFFSFGSSENGATTDVWNIGNVSPRTPLGVLELTLNILKRSGYDLDKSRLDLTLLRRDERFQTIIEKIDE